MLMNMNTISPFKNEDILDTSIGQFVGAVSPIDAYFSEVCRANAVVAVGLTFMAFSVLDFDVEKGLLKVVTNMLLWILW